MDAIPFSELLPALVEPLGLAAVFAMAIWAGVRVTLVGIAAWRDVTLERAQAARLQAEALAHALRAQVEAQAALRELQGGVQRTMESQTIALRLISGHLGMGWGTTGENDDAT
jgi:hypothetical protein